MTTEDERLRLSEQMDLARLSIKSSAQNVLMLMVSLSNEGCHGHLAPLRASHGCLLDGLRLLEQGTEAAGSELAKRFADALPEHASPVLPNPGEEAS